MSGDRASADLGGRLRQARERRNLSLRQVASSTKISVGILEALEQNDLKRLPGGLFSRAFVRSFASEVGLDPDEAVLLFAALPAAPTRPTHPDRGEDVDAFESNRQIASTFVRLAAVSVPLAAALGYFGAVGRPVPSEAAARAARAPAAHVEQAQPSPPAAVASSDAPAEAPDAAPATLATAIQGAAGDERVVVSLFATRACQISVTVDGGKEVERRFQAGERHTVEVRRDLVLTSNDAGAITMTLNGAEARSLGGLGQTVTTRLSPSNFKDYLLTR